MSKRIFGHIAGVFEGQEFSSRLELSLSRIHPPLQAGISGSQLEGADSIVLSGGYEDDKDFGEVIIYTGHGGRDVSSGKQVASQILSKQNLALAKNCQLGLPVRVTRGFSHKSSFSPASGYRYDGLFYVESYWKEKGKSGYDVWRYRLYKEAANSNLILEEDQEEYGKRNPNRKLVTIQRIIRDTEIGRIVKSIYQYKCQVCNERIETNAGYYAEAAHIQPLGSPHSGPDVLENVLCLCPNHHVTFDFGGFAIADDYSFLGLEGCLTINIQHKLNVEYIRYHRKHFWE